MRKITVHVVLFILCMVINSCGNLLEELGIAPTYEQKMRGIWIVGGLSDEYITSAISQVDLYDPETNKWFSGVTIMPTPVSFAGIASHGDSIYVIGGFSQTGAASTTVQIYNIISDSWSSGSSLAQARANIDAVTVYDKIYIISGTINNAENTTFTMVNQVYIYDIASDSWSAHATAPGNNANVTCFALNDIIYFLGGRTNVTTVSTAHNGFMTSLSTNALTSAAELVLTTMSARIGMAGVMYKPANGPPMEILIGGYSTLTGVTGNYIFNNDIAYNPTSWAQVRYLNNQFTLTPWLSANEDYPHNVGLASAVVYDNKLYCFGGAIATAAGSLTVYNDVNCLDLSNFPAGSWQGKTNMPRGRFGHVAVKIQQ